MVSDDLGSPAVRKFYEQTNPNQPFDGRRVALNAFLAGNDLLYLGDITAGEDPDTYTTTIDILEFFTQKYTKDPAFAERVDQSAIRILTLKLHLYENFTLTSALPEEQALEGVGVSSQASFEVAQEGATLISPTLEELDDTMPDPPDQTDRIVFAPRLPLRQYLGLFFISNTRTAKQCHNCPEQPVLPVDALNQTVIRLYGPQASGQVTPFNLKSYSYDDLIPMLDEDSEAFQIENDFGRTIETYKDALVLEGANLEVNVLRLGRIGLYFQTNDASSTGKWDPTAGQWVTLSDGMSRNQVRQGIRMARKLVAPDLLLLEIQAPEVAP